MNDRVDSKTAFHFGLSEAEETRAEQLHRDCIIFDQMAEGVGGNIFSHYSSDLQQAFQTVSAGAAASFDGYLDAIYWPFEMSLTDRSQLVRDWYRASGITCGTYVVPVHDGYLPLAKKVEELAERYSSLPWLKYVTTASEIRQAKRDGVIALYGHYQPVVPAPRELAALDRAYSKGLRSFLLTYNRMDHIGVGCTERVDAGLSMFGVDVIKHCNDIGIMIDVSHCGHLTTLDACRHSKMPVSANHTSARSIHPVARSKSDDALRAIADTGGIIGVLAVPFFISADERPTIEHMLDHIDYVAGLVGWQHVAIGTDWPLTAPDDVLARTFMAEIEEVGFRAEDRIALSRTVGFDDLRDLPNITRGLVKRGYSDEQITGILGENALRVFAAVCG